MLFSSIYNERWKYINVKEVVEYMQKKWTKSKYPNILLQLLIKSLLWNINLDDLISQWNITILNKKTPVFLGSCGTLFDFGFTIWPRHNLFFSYPAL